MELNNFTISLTKTIGSKVYTFDGVADVYNMTKRDFIVLPIDLLTASIPGGEYKLNLSDANNDYGDYICIVTDYELVNSSSSNTAYSSTVKVNNL